MPAAVDIPCVLHEIHDGRKNGASKSSPSTTKEIQPCYFPTSTCQNQSGNDYEFVHVPIGSPLRLQTTKTNYTEIVLHVILSASWALALRAYTGTDSPTFGFRNRDDIKRSTSTYVCEISITEDDSVATLLLKAQNAFVESRQADDQIWDSAPFNSGILLHHAVKESGTSIAGSEKHDILVEVQSLPDGVGIDIHYRRTKVPQCMAENVAHTLAKILDEIHANHMNHAKMVGDIDIVSERDREQIWHWNHALPQAANMCVHDMITSNAREKPRSPAVCSWEGELTYGELDGMSTKLASRLAELGVCQNVVVPVLMEKSIWAVVAVVGIMKAGGAFSLMDVNQPHSRIGDIMRQVGATVLIVSDEQFSRSVQLSNNAKKLTVSRQWFEELPLNSCDLLPPSIVTSPLYIVFTSGSTGTPKGVVITHSNYLSGALLRAKAIGYNQSSLVLDLPSYNFDISLECILCTLLAGGCVCVPSESQRLNDVAGAIQAMKVNSLHTTPTVARLLECESLQLEWVRLGGETLDAVDFKWANQARLYPGYGPSECAVTSTLNLRASTASSPRNIGSGIGTVTWIVDASNHERLLPIGAIGELVIEGPTVSSLGYLNDVAKTAAAFPTVPSWLAKGTGTRSRECGRLYKTGDLVRYEADGSIIFVGRRDGQVKIRGQRLELGEIEYHLREVLPPKTILTVEVLDNPDSNQDPILAAFVSVQQQTKTHNDPSNIEDFLASEDDQCKLLDLVHKHHTGIKARLSRYMRPSVYIALQKMPLSPSGKTDRKQLREYGHHIDVKKLMSLKRGRQVITPPRNTQEEVLVQAWATVLNTKEAYISTLDSFTSLGGDSLTAMRVAAAVRLKGFVLSVENIFQNPILLNMAQKMCDATGTDDTVTFSLCEDADDLKRASAEQLTIPVEKIEDIFPCTPLQEGLLALSSRRKGEYITTNIIEVPSGKFDLPQFKAAWELVYRHNSILRSRITHIEGHGLFHVVLDETIDWSSGIDIDAEIEWGLNGPLTQIAITSSKSSFRFIWMVHHAIMDGLAKRIILDQVSEAYRGLAIGSRPQFSSFISHLCSLDRKKAEAFWRLELSDAQCSPFPALPSANYQPRASEAVTRHININKISIGHITHTTLIKAAWSIVVARQTGCGESVFGTIVTGRAAPVRDIMQIVGPTLATIPVRISLEEDESVENFLKRVQLQSLKTIPFEQFGIQDIQKLGPEQAALCRFQTLIVVQPQAGRQRETDDWIVNLLQNGDIRHEFSTYAVQMEFTPESAGYSLSAVFDPDVVHPKQMTRLINQFQYTLHQLSRTNTMKKVADISTVSEHETEEIWKWNQDIPPALHRSVHDLIIRFARDTPHSQAIDAWDGQLTYDELEKLSLRLAQHLVRLGVKAEVIVPLCFEKSMWTIISMLAVLRAGGAFVLLDRSHPKDRLEYIIKKVKADIMLVSATTASAFTSIVSQCIVVTPLFVDGLKFDSPQPETPRVSSTSAAVTLFTSGSTGVPKGMVQDHLTASTSAVAIAKAFGYGPTTRLLQFANYSFDMSVIDILTVLVGGGCICVPSEQDLMDNLPQSIRSMKVNTLCMTPSVARTLEPDEIPKVNRIVLGGEAIRKDLVDTWANRVTLINGYGPAEASVCVAGVVDPQHPLTVGRATASATWIIDEKDHSLSPIGAIGELAIEGPLLARGYLDDRTATASKFITNPDFLTSGGFGHNGRIGRVYLTGDLARYDTDGGIEICGRKDTQVKLRGQRIELGEVEHALRQRLSSDIEVAAEIITPEKGRGEPTLVAFVATVSNAEAIPEQASQQKSEDKSELRRTVLPGIDEKLRKDLPKYMIPSAFIVLPRIPLSISGKEDRKELRAIGARMTTEQLAALRTTVPQRRIEPRTQTEILLRKLWAITLKVEETRIMANDNFFGLGGDSIGAMRLVAAVRDNGRMLTVAEIFEYSRLSDMADRLADSREEIKGEIAPFSLLGGDISIEWLRKSVAVICGCIRPEQIQDIYPCTPLQEGLLSLSIQRSGSYIARNIMELPDNIDIDRFQAAWQTISSSSAILRTRIVQLTHLGLVQTVVDEHIQWKLSNDLETYLCQDKEAIIEPGMPLARYGIITDPVSLRKSFVWTTHHAIYDGWSKPLILNRVARLYQGMKLDQTTDYKAFIQYLVTMDRNKSEIYWQSQLDTAEAPIFPSLPTHSYKPRADAIVSHEIKIERRAGSNITTPTLIKAAWSLLVSRLTESKDVVFGATITGRNAPVPGIEAMEGPTFTTVPVRVQVSHDMNTAEFLESVQAQSTVMIPYEHFGIQNIRRLSEKAKAACNFQTLLVLQPQDDRDTGSSVFGPNASTGGVSANTTSEFNSYAIMLVCSISTHGFNVKASFDSNVISSEQMPRLLSQLGWTVGQLLTTPKDHTIGSLESVDPKEVIEMWCWNKTVPKKVDARVHDLFLTQVHETPDASAVHAWDGNFTYNDLEKLYSQVASYLIQFAGIGIGEIVPVFFEKSKWTLAAMLSVIKTGSTFVLLDISQPKARLQSIIEQVRPHTILASEQQSDRARELSTHAKVIELSDKIVTTLQTPDSSENCSLDFPSTTPLYIAFTSGSTGRPKGAIISHSNYLSGSLQRAHYMGFFDRKPRIFDFASYSFDVSIENMLIAILTGGCVCVPSHERRINDVEGAIAEMEVDTLHITPSLARLLKPEKLPLLRTVRLGGEAMAEIDIRMWKGRVNLFNSYGPSECGVTCVMNLDVKNNPANIGRGVAANTWVVDRQDHTKLVPIGATGELLIEGPTVGQGYWNELSKTEAAFVESPLWLLNGTTGFPGRSGKLYKTGDLVRYETDGTIVFMGRKDNQVKLHGQRIELSEIEYHLRRIFSRGEGFVDALVEVVTPAGGQPKLVAFIAIGGADKKAVQLQNVLHNMVGQVQGNIRNSLPSYMVPFAYVAISRIPLNSSGKVDRKQLQQMDISMIRGEVEEKRAPVTLKEHALQALWATTLKVEADNIGIDDSFFDIGGDSIVAMRLVAAARAKGLSLSIADVFDHGQLSDMALVLKTANHSSKATTRHQPFSFVDAPDISAYVEEVRKHQIKNSNWTIEDILPTTDYQDFTITRSYTKPRDQLLYELIYLDSSIDKNGLIKSCQQLVARHEILRTVFINDNNGWLGVVLSDNIIEIDEYHTEENIEDFAKSVCRRDSDSEALTPGSPLARFMFITHLNGSKCLAVRISHAQYDGIGLYELLNDLGKIYDGTSLSSAVGFSSYIHHVHQIPNLDSYAYWRALLNGATMTRLPLERDTSKALAKNSLPAKISYQATRIISDLHAPAGIIMGTVVTAAWAITLTRQCQSQTQDVTFGRLVSGRNVTLDGADRLAGPCINVAPVRVKLRHTQSVLDVLHTVQAQGIASTPFETLRLQELVKNCTDWDPETQFDSVVQHQNIESVRTLKFGNYQAGVESHIPHTQLSQWLWLLSVPTQDGGLKIKLSGRQSMSMAVEGLIELFCSTLQRMLQDPGARMVEDL